MVKDVEQHSMLLALPVERQERILSFLEPQSLHALSQVCQSIHTLVSNYVKRGEAVIRLKINLEMLGIVAQGGDRDILEFGKKALSPDATLTILNRKAILVNHRLSAAFIMKLIAGNYSKNKKLPYLDAAVQELLKSGTYAPITSWVDKAQEYAPEFDLTAELGLVRTENDMLSFCYVLLKKHKRLIYDLCVDHLYQRKIARRSNKKFERKETELHKFWQFIRSEYLYEQGICNVCQGLDCISCNTDAGGGQFKSTFEKARYVMKFIRDVKMKG